MRRAGVVCGSVIREEKYDQSWRRVGGREE